MSLRRFLRPPRLGQDNRTANRRRFLLCAIPLFLACNVFLFGKRNGWWNQKCLVVLPGPFQIGSDIPLLERADSPFVSPISAKLTPYGSNTVKIRVEFQFKGDERVDRCIRVNVVAYDDNKHVIGGKIFECKDQRIVAREPSANRPFRFRKRPVNSVPALIHTSTNGIQGIAQVVIRFEEIKRTPIDS